MPKLLATLLLLLLLTGCSSRFAYNNLDWLVYWYVDDYVELERAQKAAFDENLEQWLAWHREEELIQYRRHLSELRQQLSAGSLSQQQWLGHFERGRQHWERLLTRVSPQLVSFAVLLSDEQVDSLFAEVVENNTEAMEEYLDTPADERLPERIEDMQEQMERWLGDLSSLQQDIISDYAARLKPTFASRQDYRQRVQSAARQLLSQRRSEADFQPRLQQLLVHPDQYQDEQLKQDSLHNQRLFAHLSAVLNQTLSAKQKQHIDKKLGKLIGDIDDLLPDRLRVQMTSNG